MHPIRLAVVLLCALVLPVHAQQAAPAADVAHDAQAASAPKGGHPADTAIGAKIRAALKQLNADLEPDYIGPSAVPGYQEVIIRGQVVFVTDDGSYLVQGLMDLRDKRDIAQFGALPGRRRKALEEIPASERIVFAPQGAIRHTVSVFTDVECGFCRKLHQEIAEYNKLGIAIEYLAYPRAGVDSPDGAKMASVWCSADRRKALTDAKSDVAIPTLTCASPVAKQYAIGQRVGLQGTPMIINADGIALPGYMPPADLLEALDMLAAQRKTN